MEDKVREAIIDELKRQAEIGGLEVRAEGDRLELRGAVDVDALVMVVIGSMAGGP